MTTRAKYLHEAGCDVSTGIPCTCDEPYPLRKPVECCVCDADVSSPERPVIVAEYGPAHARCAVAAGLEETR